MTFPIVSWEGAKAVIEPRGLLDDAVALAWARIKADKSPVTIEDVDTDRVWNELQIKAERERRRLIG